MGGLLIYVYGKCHYTLGLAVDLNRNLDLIILHKLLIVSRPLSMENGILMSKLLPDLLCNMRNKTEQEEW